MGFSSETINKALDEINVRRERAIAVYEAEKKKFYTDCPEIRDLENELGQKGSALAVAAIGKSRDELKKLTDEIKALSSTVDEIKKKAGFSKEPAYVCRKCNDTGYCGGRLCDCVREIAKRIEYSGLSNVMPIEKCTFQSFDLSYYPTERDENGVSPKKQMESVYKNCRAFAESFPAGKNLLLMGKSGLGKTHLSLAIANEVIKKGHSVIYGTAQSLINEVSRETFDRSGSTVKIDALCSCDLLILDDLGTEFSTQLSASIVNNIVDTRLLKNLSTVISTNLTVKEISETYHERITSRFLGNYILCPCFGDDIRLKNSVNK